MGSVVQKQGHANLVAVIGFASELFFESLLHGAERDTALQAVRRFLIGREEKVLRLRFGIGDGYPRTLEEVGHIFNVTRERVRQIELEALRRLSTAHEVVSLGTPG